MKHFFYIVVFTLSLSLQAQHSPMYSQYLVNGLAINPAYAGRNDALDITLLHRRQWVGFEGAPITTALTINTPLRQKKYNIGLSVIDDRVGNSNNQSINVMYAYRIKAGEVNIALGLQAGIDLKKTNWSNLKRNDLQDGLLNNESVRNTGFTSGAGLYVHTKNLFVGLSSPYLINTTNTFSYKESPLFLNAGYLFNLSDEHSIKPSLLVKYITASPSQLDINVNYYYKSLFGLGVSYRTQESVVGIAEIGITQQFKLCYSYDFAIGAIRKYQAGSHEFLLRYYFGYSYYAKNPRAFSL